MNKNLDNIKLVVLDVDGTLTDGGVYIDNNGVESKKFNIKDGAGIILAKEKGIDFMILTGRQSYCVKKRAEELKIKYIFQGIQDKLSFLRNFLSKEEIPSKEVAYIGDDINDLDCINFVGFSACPNDAIMKVRTHVDFISHYNGGNGAVRELCDLIIENQKKNESEKV